MKVAVIQFPGSNCDLDAVWALELAGLRAELVWHTQGSLEGFGAALLPGGFSYGDYLRAGALAKFSPVMEAVRGLAERGNPVIGICNGFQALTEAQLLPGALLANNNLHYTCKDVFLKVERQTAFTSEYKTGQVLRVPIAHGEGRYYADDETLKALEDNGQIVFRYVRPPSTSGRGAGGEGQFNPNGSLNDIAGIVNQRGNVLGMMPHPERVVDEVLGGTDGLGFFQSLRRALEVVA